MLTAPGKSLPELLVTVALGMGVAFSDAADFSGIVDPSVERLQIFKLLLGSFFPLSALILAVLGTIIFGWATPTEAAAMGAAGGLLLAAAAGCATGRYNGTPSAFARDLLQRIGRSGHSVGRAPKGRFFPLTRDQLVECAAIVKGAREGILDKITMSAFDHGRYTLYDGSPEGKPSLNSTYVNYARVGITGRLLVDGDTIILAALKSTRVNSSAAELYGNVMGLGRTAGTGESELFGVKVPQNNLPRLYWRMRAYDTYKDGSWQTFNTQSTPFDPNEENHQTPDFMPSTVATFTFKWQSDQSTRMVTPSQPVWTSRTGSIQTISDPGGENDILSWSASPNIRTGDQYLVRAMLENPTQKELRASGSDYPAWVKEHYLPIPASLAVEYKQLAEQITTGSTNNYDKAEAVTDYLRQNITYSDTIPVPPEGVEPMIWFLFSQKSGFCNYYASAEVLLLRSVGIPARLVVGFAQGQSSEPKSYTIRGQDAHAWPEVFFPGIGWVQFEPTVNQAILVRPSGETVSGSGASNPRSGFADGSRNNPRFDQENDPFSSGSASNSMRL